MSDCPPIRSRRAAFLDGELPAAESAEVRAHLEACDGCREDFERERAFLDAVAGAGRETAPPELRRRVEAVLESGAAVAAPAGSGRRAWVLLAAAAVVALLLVARPWGGDPAGTEGLAFAADHRAHAASAPGPAPVPGVDPPPPLGPAGVRGLSTCVVEGREYAHFAYRAEGRTISVFVPLDDAPPPTVAAGEGPTTVVAVGSAAGRPGAVLVADGLAEPALRRLWDGG